jgi:Xaa-Pro aminopeptidase
MNQSDGLMKKRLAEYRALIRDPRSEALIILDHKTIRHIIGIAPADGCLVLYRNAAQVFTGIADYAMFRKKGCAATVHCAEKSPWIDALLSIHSKGVKTLKVDTVKTPAAFINLGNKLVGTIRWVDAGDDMAAVRAVKSRNEIARITEAVHLSERALDSLLKNLKTGMREKTAAVMLNTGLIELSGELPFFPSMAAFGENTACPHWQSGSRRLEVGDTIVIDWGGCVDGYGADLTRTFFWKKAGGWQLRRYKRIRCILGTLIGMVKPGMKASEVEERARSLMNGNGAGESSIHSIGHGVGLDVHELPNFTMDSQDTIMINMVFALEPGCYIPGWGGIRLEEMVTMVSSGARVLAARPVDEIPILKD